MTVTAVTGLRPEEWVHILEGVLYSREKQPPTIERGEIYSSSLIHEGGVVAPVMLAPGRPVD